MVAQFIGKNKLNMKETVRNYFSFIGLLIVTVVFEFLTEGNLL